MKKIYLLIAFLCFILTAPLAVSFSHSQLSIIEKTSFSTDNVPKSQGAEAQQVWTNPTYKTFDDYFTDFNITEEIITEEDLIGSGSEFAPYVVKSTIGFLYLIKTTYLLDKYIELACDIYLNDESFDENGSPIGGDGVIYSWIEITNQIKVFDGKNHVVYGLYSNESEKTTASLLGMSCVRVANLKIFNFYICAKLAAPVCYYLMESAENVVTEGFINGERVGGIIVQPHYAATNVIVKNCISKSKIEHSSIAGGGIVAQSGGKPLLIQDCKNYGEISCYWSAGGILGYNEHVAKVEIENCENHGNFVWERNSSCLPGGFLGISYNKKNDIEITDSKNYGNNAFAGMVAYFEGFLAIVNCENHGKVIEGVESGEIIATISSGNVETKITIVNCKIFSKAGRPIIGNIWSEAIENIYIDIKNVVVDFCDSQVSPYYIIVRYIDSANYETRINVNGLQVVDKREASSLVLYGWLTDRTTISLKNIVLFLECDSANRFALMEYKNDEKILNVSIIIFCKKSTADNKQYYGTDFSGFYIDFKTGKIGIKSLSGKGFYQGRVTEEYLTNKGFEKREV